MKIGDYYGAMKLGDFCGPRFIVRIFGGVATVVLSYWIGINILFKGT